MKFQNVLKFQGYDRGTSTDGHEPFKEDIEEINKVMQANPGDGFEKRTITVGIENTDDGFYIVMTCNPEYGEDIVFKNGPYQSVTEMNKVFPSIMYFFNARFDQSEFGPDHPNFCTFMNNVAKPMGL